MTPEELEKELYNISADRLKADLPEIQFLISFMVSIKYPSKWFAVDRILYTFGLTRDTYLNSELFEKHCFLLKLKEDDIRKILK